MYIYIARHAWAHHFGDPRWPNDSERALEAAGAERYARVVQTLAARGFAPDVIATSPYTRCRQTAELIAQHTPGTAEITELAALTPGSDFQALTDWSQTTGSQHICWVGHAPDVGRLTGALVGDHQADLRFAKGAVAAVRLHEPPGYNCGELYWLVTAKSLGI